MTAGLTADFTALRLDEMQAAFGGIFVRARASLGASAFGLQILELPANTGDLMPEHDHLHDGQEEIYLLLRGTADLHLPGRVIALDPETLVRVGPQTRRRLRSGPDGARILAIGATPAHAYQPPANTMLAGPETLPCPTASSSLVPDGPPPQLP